MSGQLDFTTLVGGAMGGSGLTILAVIMMSLSEGPSAQQQAETDVVALGDLLSNIEVTSLAPDHKHFLPPTDFREMHYNELRAKAATMSDLAIMEQYMRHWETFMQAKDRNDGFALPRAAAHNIATPMHALWREIQQRDLNETLQAPDFGVAWDYLITDDAQFTLSRI